MPDASITVLALCLDVATDARSSCTPATPRTRRTCAASSTSSRWKSTFLIGLLPTASRGPHRRRTSGVASPTAQSRSSLQDRSAIGGLSATTRCGCRYLRPLVQLVREPSSCFRTPTVEQDGRWHRRLCTTMFTQSQSRCPDLLGSVEVEQSAVRATTSLADYAVHATPGMHARDSPSTSDSRHATPLRNRW